MIATLAASTASLAQLPTQATPVAGREIPNRSDVRNRTQILLPDVLTVPTVPPVALNNSDAGAVVQLAINPNFADATSDQSPAEELPMPAGALETPLPAYGPAATQIFSTVDEQAIAEAESLRLADVIASVYRSFPEIIAARSEFERAAGEIQSAMGAYDSKLLGYTLSEPSGFYENDRQGVSIARQTWWGGYVSAGYRIGRGDFQPWYKERETDKAGELKLALGMPLLQGRAIDPQRVAVFQASLEQNAASPIIQQAILQTCLEASNQYWKWVVAGQKLVVQRKLVMVAQERGDQVQKLVDAGSQAEIDVIVNNQLIAERTVQLTDAQKQFRAAAFKLSLYVRDDSSQPMVPSDSWLPEEIPGTVPIANREFDLDLADAVARRPEPLLIRLQIQEQQIDRRLAQNNLLPRLDMIAETSQDMGAPASSSDDKSQFQLMVGLQGEVPIQRRKARGKIRSTSAKTQQLLQKLDLQQNKIGVELKTAYNALILSKQAVEQAELSRQAAALSLEKQRIAFEKGKVDLIYLNIIETKAFETEIKLLSEQLLWLSNLAEMQAALGLDPLEQSFLIDTLPNAR
jgi:outer membrane protein TolC